MMFKLLVNCGILFLLLVQNVSYADENKAEINYEIFFDKMEMIKGSDILVVDLEIKKTGATHFLVNGFIEHFKQFDNDWTMALRVLVSDTADGKYRVLANYPMQGKKTICSVLKNEYKKYFYESLKNCSNAPHYDTCPLTPDKYTITGYEFDAGIFKKFLSSGYYVVNALFSHLEESDLVQYDIHLHVVGDN